MGQPRRSVAAPESSATPRWTRLFLYRAERLQTTWTLRLALVAFVVAVAWLTSGWWTAALARSLVCDAGGPAAKPSPGLVFAPAPSDAMLLDNFDPDYLLFERANRLRRAGAAKRVLVPVPKDRGSDQPNDVSVGIAQVMARIARTGDIEIIPTREAEPITLNAARDIQRFLEREHIRSLIIVSPLFRSRRSALVYAATLGRAGIAVRCEPVQGSRGVNDWTRTWHGVQEVVEQWLKLQYYRFYVLPFRH